jgi:3',5'-cyclic AMP phosphodiesterase CpdA
MLTLAQITDLHITSDKDLLTKNRNEKRLRSVLQAIRRRRPRPDAIIASGDLVDRGEVEEYAELKKILDEVEIPLFLGLGNHDLRGPFRQTFPDTPVDADGFVQYAVELDGLRLVMCDTVDEGNSEAGFCDKRASWLEKTLDAAPGVPTIVVLHHPAIPSGIRWMDPDPDADWIVRMRKALERRTQVVTIIAGHVHRAYFGTFAGHTLSIGPATSPQLTLDMTDIDVRAPDGREIVVEEPPGYSLLAWDRGVLTTHFCVAGDYPSAATFQMPLAGNNTIPWPNT